MIRVSSISLTQFKNYKQAQFDFTEKIVGICGKNGVGKTNLLDAIYSICFTKGYFTRDALNVQHGNDGFRVEATIKLLDKTEKAVCVFRETGKKDVLINNAAYDKFSQHIGRYPCVIVAPDDARLITGDSKERRNFLDALLSQLDSFYLQQLIAYKKTLEQRNSLLKLLATQSKKDFILLDVLDEQLIKPCMLIFERRQFFFKIFLPIVEELYQNISKQSETIGLIYESQLLTADFASLLKKTREKDLITQRSNCGIHRDDVEMWMGNPQHSFKTLASQGQRKSLLFALKLAEMSMLKNEKQFSPILLLDDVFEKLDEERVGNLLQKVAVENDGQVFITDTDENRLKKQLSALKEDFQIIRL